MAGTDTSRRGEARLLDDGPAIVLVEPQLGENIGTSARAMLNCGLTDLRLVAPRDEWPNEKARAACSGADLVIDQATVHADLASAISNTHRVYATTARQRDMIKPVMTPRAAILDMRAATARGERVAVLFGRERSGLTNEEIVQANVIVAAPLNPSFASLNIAQAVLMIAYEWLMSVDETPDRELTLSRSEPATVAEVDHFLDHLDRELESADFYREANLKPTMQRNLHNIFRRADLTDQEIRTLHGVVARLSSRRPRAPDA